MVRKIYTHWAGGAQTEKIYPVFEYEVKKAGQKIGRAKTRIKNIYQSR